MTVPSKRSIKGNDGKARRKSHCRKLFTVVGLCGAVIAIVELTGFGGPTSRKSVQQLRASASALSSAARDFAKKNHNQSLSPKTEQEKIDLILSGSVHLVDIILRKGEMINSAHKSYEGVTGQFCRLDWYKHKANPSAVPMFRDLVSASPNCKQNTFTMDLKKIATMAREHDNDVAKRGDSIPRAMEPQGFVFHESRCGSTLVANSLVAMDPTQHRVYSESAPPITALKACGLDGQYCSVEKAAELFRDVVYMMGRTDDPQETHVFFKIQSVGTKNLDVFMEAFPDTPWIFVYRDPVEVLTSQLSHGVQEANCVRQMRELPESARNQLKSLGRSVTSLSGEEKCSLHLSTLCAAAVLALSTSNNGRAVNYKMLPNILFDEIIPDHFGVPVSDDAQQLIIDVSTKYSKGRGAKAAEWKDDTEKKEAEVTPEIKLASKLFLESTFHQLEDLAAAEDDD